MQIWRGYVAGTTWCASRRGSPWLLSVLLVIASAIGGGSASAQTPIVIGPTSDFLWDVVAPTVASAQAFTYAISVDGGPPTTLNPAGITCSGGGPGSTIQTCKILIAGNIPVGSHSLTMTAANGSVIGGVSAPFTYVTLAIPIPSNLRFQ